MTSTWTSSARRRARLRATAIRHAQIQGLAILKCLDNPRDRVVDRHSILSCRPWRDCIPSRLCSASSTLCTRIPSAVRIVRLDELVESGHTLGPAACTSSQNEVDEENEQQAPWCELPAFCNNVFSDDTCETTLNPRAAIFEPGALGLDPHVDIRSEAAASEICTTADSSIDRHEDPEAVKPPTEAVPIPGGVCVASSPGVDDLQAGDEDHITDPDRAFDIEREAAASDVSSGELCYYRYSDMFAEHDDDEGYASDELVHFRSSNIFAEHDDDGDSYDEPLCSRSSDMSVEHDDGGESVGALLQQSQRGDVQADDDEGHLAPYESSLGAATWNCFLEVLDLHSISAVSTSHFELARSFDV